VSWSVFLCSPRKLRVFPRRFRALVWQPPESCRSRKLREFFQRFRDFKSDCYRFGSMVFILNSAPTVFLFSLSVQAPSRVFLSHKHWLPPTWIQNPTLHSSLEWFFVRLSQDLPSLVSLCTWWNPSLLGGSFSPVFSNPKRLEVAWELPIFVW
jgi:hypothetical protein